MNLFLPLQNHPEYLIKRKHSPAPEYYNHRYLNQ